tara:strand:+ start:3154 stop:3309 length:156 start_codon:yes stop_codon:yes gene_type:complete
MEKESKESKEYLESLNEKEKKAFVIAKSFLQSSFDLKKSIGFKKWANKKKS